MSDIVTVKVGLVLNTIDGSKKLLGEAEFEIDDPNWGVLYTTIEEVRRKKEVVS